MSWLGGSAALAILSFDVDAESPILVEGRRYADDPVLMSHQAYGPQVAVPRILRLLEEYSLPATFFVPTADNYPDAVEQIASAGQEIAHHGYSHHSPRVLDEAAERADLERALRSLERLGVRPSGYRTPSWNQPRTFDLLAEYGLEYDSSLMDDDRPYLLETAAGPLVELPPHWGLDDWNQYAYLPDPRSGPGTVHPPSRALSLWARAGRNEAARLPVRADDASVSERPAGPGRRAAHADRTRTRLRRRRVRQLRGGSATGGGGCRASRRALRRVEPDPDLLRLGDSLREAAADQDAAVAQAYRPAQHLVARARRMRHVKRASPPRNPARSSAGREPPARRAEQSTLPLRTRLPVSFRATAIEAAKGFPAFECGGEVAKRTSTSLKGGGPAGGGGGGGPVGGGGGGGGGGGAGAQLEKHSRPDPNRLFGPAEPRWAVRDRSWIMSALGESAGCCWRTSAAAPATSGVAADVPRKPSLQFLDSLIVLVETPS